MIYPGEDAAELMRLVRDWLPVAPGALSVMVMLATAPPAPFVPAVLHGRPIAMANIAWSGPLDDGARVLAPLRAFRPAAVDMVAPMPYTALQQMTDPMAVPGLQYYLKAPFLRELDDAGIDGMLRAQRDVTSPLSAIGLGFLGGAIRAVPDDHSAFAHRHAAWMCDIVAAWPAPSTDAAAHVGWARNLWRDLDHASTGSYVNHLGNDEIDDRRGYAGIQATRLAALKARWDPDNVFRLNPNVRPAVAA
jgi:hypothetical protein